MLLKLKQSQPVASGYCWFVAGVVNSWERTTETAMEAGSVSHMTSFYSVLF